MSIRLISRCVAALVAVLMVGACTPGQSRDRAAATPTGPAIGGDRPVRVLLPPADRLGAPAPLVILLHGYGGDARREEDYLRFAPAAAEAGMIYAIPQGTPDNNGLNYWNAGDACCGAATDKPDDSAYLARIVGELTSAYPIDPERVYVFGISNGGFMAHRFACEHAGLVTAIASAAGAGAPAADTCAPSEPVAVLQLHGDADSVVAYGGGSLDAEYPSAETTVRDWAKRNGCTGAATPGPKRDLAVAADVEVPGDRPLDGPETTTLSYPGCRPGGAAELWTVAGGDHVPALTETYAQQVLEFFRKW